MKRLILGLLALLGPSYAGAAEELQTIIVRPGDTLWSISNTYLKDPKRWNELLKHNRLPSSDPSIALPGMALKVPVSLLKAQYRAAKLVYFLNEVLLRPSGVSDWKNVSASMDLFKADTLRTRAGARADVKFYTGEILNLYPNSIAVLRPPGDKDTDVRLMAGEMRGLRSRVVTASARITPKTKDTEFGAKIKDDLTTLVQVYKGKADVEAGGKTVEVPAGFASEVRMDMQPSNPVKLPKLPDFDATRTALASGGKTPQLTTTGGVVSLNMGRPGKQPAGGDLPKADPGGAKVPDLNDKSLDAAEIIKLISVGNPVQSYHLQVSREQTFSSTVLDKNYDSFEDINLNSLLPPGNYYMRVALIDLLGFEGKFSAPRPVKVGGPR
ncbi:MAG: hypothetical protein CVU79_09455 [Elusimicrobia bacterium HGW-Elusimicrobia-3]|jgi:hypothetical protein|nr:MAG: hypothetical protein CVU79_09455 [Elusimicrobia bacterium HGW-Elusimicrobia-3]